MAPPGAGPKTDSRAGWGCACNGRPMARIPRSCCKDWMDSASALGALVLDPPRLEPFGAEARLRDPEANHLLLLVLP